MANPQLMDRPAPREAQPDEFRPGVVTPQLPKAVQRGGPDIAPSTMIQPLAAWEEDASAVHVLAVDDIGWAFVSELAADPVGRTILQGRNAAAEARGAARQLLARTRWSAHLGPFRSNNWVQTRGLDPGALLALETGSGQVVFPTFQFVSDAVLEGVEEVRDVLVDVASPWLVGSWFVSPQAELGDQTPVTALRRGHRDDVVAAARRWRSALTA